MSRQFNTDCEGPISKNDNAFELAQALIPHGGQFFAKLSKYDDFLADIAHKPGYKAGDTLRLILPFFKAFGVTDAILWEFSSQNILLVPEAHTALRQIQDVMPAFIISTSYCPYINALCQIIGFPTKNAYCTEVSLDTIRITEAERNYIRALHREILELPDIRITAPVQKKEDMDPDSMECIDRLDHIFWSELADTECGKLLDEVSPIGGFEKAEAVKESCKKTGNELKDVIYVGDSITDVEAIRTVREAGGITVSFNGNRYAVQTAEVICISPDALILSQLASAFDAGGGRAVRDLVRRRQAQHNRVQEGKKPGNTGLSSSRVAKLFLVTESLLPDLILESETFRKTVRGKQIGELG